MTAATGISMDMSLKAVSHPLRAAILAALDLGPKTPSELADELGEELPKVAYHVRVLRDLGAIELVREEIRNGTIAHVYRTRRRAYASNEDWAGLTPAQRTGFAGVLFQAMLDDFRRALANGGFQKPEGVHMRFPLRLRPEGWDELNERMVELFERAVELHAEGLVDDPETEPAFMYLLLVDPGG